MGDEVPFDDEEFEPVDCVGLTCPDCCSTDIEKRVFRNEEHGLHGDYHDNYRCRTCQTQWWD